MFWFNVVPTMHCSGAKVFFRCDKLMERPDSHSKCQQRPEALCFGDKFPEHFFACASSS
jgi:hypothetical protein